MGRTLRIVSWNANGLASKRHELLHFLTEYDVDVALLQETHLAPSVRFTAPNYAVYRTARPLQAGARQWGGTAILVHRRLPHRHLPRAGWTMEVTSVAVAYGGAEVELTSVYCRPRSLIVEAEMDRLLQPGVPALVAGDFNAKHTDWGCRSINPPGTRLHTYVSERMYIGVTSPDCPTHYHNDGRLQPDLLDFALHSHLPAAVFADAVSDLSSDHLPVLLYLEDHATAMLPPGRRPKVNWRRYRNYLADRPQRLGPPGTAAQLDEQVELLQSTLQEAVRLASTPAPDAPHHRRDLPAGLAAEVRLRKRLRREWQLSRCPLAKADFNRQSRKVARLLQDRSEGQWRDFVSTLSPDDGSVWRLTRALRREKPVLHPLRRNGTLVYSPGEKADTFADVMEEQFSPHPDIVDEDHSAAVAAHLATLDDEVPEDDDPLRPISDEEVARALSRLKPRKAPGPDSLGAPALRDLPEWVISWITTLFNSCLSLNHFPSLWKRAKLVLIQKPRKSPLLPENYRPISLLPALSKVLERLILARFPEEFFLAIREEQYGFRRGHSTTLQLATLVTRLVDNGNRRLHTAAVLLDVSKAFDRVWHEGLVFKLSHSPLPRCLLRLIESYLTGRQFAVAVGSATSSFRPITAGVPQGSVLGPVLYLWYTNDMPLAPGVTLSLFADDALLHSASMRIHQACVYLQRSLHLLEPWLRKWRTKVNTSKCEAICFTRKRYGEAMRERLTLDGDPIRWTKAATYLGVRLSRTLCMTPAAKHRLDVGRAAFRGLLPILRPSSPMSLGIKLQVYKSIVRPTFTYGAAAWYPLTSLTTKRTIEALQNRCLRAITASPWYVRNSVIREATGIETVGEFVTRLSRDMFTRAETSPFPHLRALATADGPPETIYRRPRTILDDPP